MPIFSSKLTLGFIEGKLSEFRIRAPKFREVKGGSHVNLGGISLDFFSMTHSIPGALGVFIRTNQGTVMHTGDFKLDQTPIDGVTPDYAAISRFAKQGIDLLLSDSTNATVPGFTKSEAEVGPNLLHAIKNAPGRVFVASFSSHIHRLQQICDAARKCGRKVVVTGRSMLTNTRVARELGYLNIDDADIIDAFDIDNLPDDKIVVMCTGSQGEPLSALCPAWPTASTRRFLFTRAIPSSSRQLPFLATRRQSSRSSTAWPSSAATSGISPAPSSTSRATVARRSSSF